MSGEGYLLADQPSELQRLQLQSRAWEPSGRQLLAKVGEGDAERRAAQLGSAFQFERTACLASVG